MQKWHTAAGGKATESASGFKKVECKFAGKARPSDMLKGAGQSPPLPHAVRVSLESVD